MQFVLTAEDKIINMVNLQTDREVPLDVRIFKESGYSRVEKLLLRQEKAIKL